MIRGQHVDLTIWAPWKFLKTEISNWKIPGKMVKEWARHGFSMSAENIIVAAWR
jgi:hypothetical protein